MVLMFYTAFLLEHDELNLVLMLEVQFSEKSKDWHYNSS